jgi:hypothetical protein
LVFLDAVNNIKKFGFSKGFERNSEKDKDNYSCNSYPDNVNILPTPENVDKVEKYNNDSLSKESYLNIYLPPSESLTSLSSQLTSGTFALSPNSQSSPSSSSSLLLSSSLTPLNSFPSSSSSSSIYSSSFYSLNKSNFLISINSYRAKCIISKLFLFYAELEKINNTDLESGFSSSFNILKLKYCN